MYVYASMRVFIADLIKMLSSKPLQKFFLLLALSLIVFLVDLATHNAALADGEGDEPDLSQQKSSRSFIPLPSLPQITSRAVIVVSHTHHIAVVRLWVLRCASV